MVIPLIELYLRKKEGKKNKLPRVLHRVRLKLEPSRARGPGGTSLFYMNHYKFLKIHKLKIDVAFSVFWS